MLICNNIFYFNGRTQYVQDVTTNGGSVAMTTVMPEGAVKHPHSSSPQLSFSLSHTHLQYYRDIRVVWRFNITEKPHLRQGRLLRHLSLGSRRQCAYLFHVGGKRMHAGLFFFFFYTTSHCTFSSIRPALYWATVGLNFCDTPDICLHPASSWTCIR